MDPATSDFAPIRLSTRDFPERDRVAEWREVLRRSVVRLDIEPLPSVGIHGDVTLRVLPGLAFAQCAVWGVRERRTREMISDGNDSLGLILNVSGLFIASNRDREVTLAAGDALLGSSAEVGTYTRPVPGKFLSLVFPRSELTPLVTNIDDVVRRPMARDSEALRLLIGYLGLLGNDRALASPELRRLAASHVRDLVALAIGATRDAAALAEGRGGRAARLRAIMVDIVENLGRGDLAIDTISRRHRLAVRYIQRLFEEEGSTYSEFVMSRRLAQAHRMLTDPAQRGPSIGDIAAACGFNDQAYFNRRFRQLYGASPSDVRAAARKRDEA